MESASHNFFKYKISVSDRMAELWQSKPRKETNSDIANSATGEVIALTDNAKRISFTSSGVASHAEC